MSKILVITAHPDDAELCMGGTIAKLVHEGNVVKNLIVSIPDSVEIRKYEAELSSNILGMDLEFLNASFPCQVEDLSLSGVISLLDKLIYDYQPDFIFTHWEHDSHQDHRIVSQAVLSCLRKKKFNLYFFEQTNQGNLIKSNKFVPNIYVDISNYIDVKIEAFKVHKSQQIGYLSHYIDDIIMLSKWRGFQINSTHAESFQLVYKQDL